MTPTFEGSCFCGAVRYKSTGEIQKKVLCHCTDCRKITSSVFSTNLVVAGDGFSVTQGTPKSISKIADSGEQITSYFCGDCGSTMWRDGKTFGDSKVIKAGTIDGDVGLETAKPNFEVFVQHRISWLPAMEGTVTM